jgi:protein TonB
MTPNDSNDPIKIFKTGTTITDAPSWFDSLLRQIRELRDEKKNPRPQVKITAQRDPSALNNLIEMPSPISSLFSDIREAIDDYLHPRKIETSAELVEVEEIWSKPKAGVPRLLSIFAHVLIVSLALVPWATSIPKLPKANETSIVLLQPQNLILPVSPDKRESGGGGGGGRKTLTPPSLGKLPKAADKQIVPPDPEPPKNPDPKLVVEPSIVAPQLANLPQINLLSNLGDPNGIAGPPSAGPGQGGGIGTGIGRGVGEGKGPGAGPGEGGGAGGGVFRVGGGVSPPSVLSRVEPQYSEEARKARYQGTVVLEAIVRKDGTVDILRVVRSLGFGLDENAIQALKQWHFRPGMKGGVAVDVALNIEVNFNLR